MSEINKAVERLKAERPGSGKWNNALAKLLDAARAEGLGSPSGGGVEAAYKRGWSDCENEFLGRAADILPEGSVVFPGPSSDRSRDEFNLTASNEELIAQALSHPPVTPPPPTGEVGGVEPVAWRWRYPHTDWHVSYERKGWFDDKSDVRLIVQPLFAAPPSREA